MNKLYYILNRIQQKDLALMLGINPRSIRRYQEGTRKPRPDIQQQINNIYYQVKEYKLKKAKSRKEKKENITKGGVGKKIILPPPPEVEEEVFEGGILYQSFTYNGYWPEGSVIPFILSAMARHEKYWLDQGQDNIIVKMTFVSKSKLERIMSTPYMDILLWRQELARKLNELFEEVRTKSGILYVISFTVSGVSQNVRPVRVAPGMEVK